MPLPTPSLPTTVVGSYPQPDWLVNREMLSKVVPRTRMREIWRIPEPFLEQAQDDATLLAIRDMERAGIDIITDGEIRRESYSNRFATALEGIDLDNPGEVQTRSGAMTPVPRVVGKIRRTRPVELRDMQFLRAQHRPAGQDHAARARSRWASRRRTSSTRTTKRWRWTSPRRVNEEARDLQKAGADVHPARRAVAAQRPRGGEALRRQGDQPRAAGHHGADGRASLLRLRRGGAGRDASRPAIPSCRSSPTASRSRSRSRRRSPSSTSAC